MTLLLLRRLLFAARAPAWSLFLFLIAASASAQSTIITGFTLFNAETDTDLRDLVDGDIVNLNDFVDDIPLTIRVNVDSSAISNTIIDRVVFDLDDGVTIRSESEAPYFLAGDSDGDAYATGRLQIIGKHSLEVTVYSSNNDEAIDSARIEFRIIDSIEGQAPNEATPAPSGIYDVPGYETAPNGLVQGELKKWHKVTIGFSGPPTGERNNVENPFTLFRLDVTFQHNGSTNKTYTVPGYYAANGNAHNTGSTSGSVWLVHFRPDEIGTWTYTASFLTDENGISINGSRNIVSGSFFDGATGSFDIAPTDKTGRDLRGKGRLQYVGEHHLRFAETGEYFIKAGADSPENFLAYIDFDNTPNNNNYRKDWSPHYNDYVDGNPTWNNGKGKAIMGAVNYLASKGVNVFSFLSMNIGGDDKNVFPYLSDSPEDFDRIDVSKTAQWDIVFDHAEQNGMYLHFKTQETENDSLLDNGELGDYRKLYYRELIARFGHHLALNWNLGEENTNTDAQRKAYADFFKENDPYGHPVVMHTYPGAQEQNFSPLLGYSNFDGASIQTGFDSGFSQTLEWVTRSASAGHKWVVGFDEQAPSTDGVVPDSADPTHDGVRKNVLWANFMAGGAGVEYYFGYSFDNSDLTCQDFRSRDAMWDQNRVALDFFEQHVPFWRMSNANARITNNNWCLFERDGGATVACYLSNGGSGDIDLTGIVTTGDYTVKWYDPRVGGDLQDGSVTSLPSDAVSSIGNAPYNTDQDWAVLIRAPQPTPAPTASPATSAPTKAPIAVIVPAPVAPPTSAPPTSAPPTSAPTTAQPVAPPVEPPMELPVEPPIADTATAPTQPETSPAPLAQQSAVPAATSDATTAPVAAPPTSELSFNSDGAESSGNRAANIILVLTVVPLLSALVW